MFISIPSCSWLQVLSLWTQCDQIGQNFAVWLLSLDNFLPFLLNKQFQNMVCWTSFDIKSSWVWIFWNFNLSFNILATFPNYLANFVSFFWSLCLWCILWSFVLWCCVLDAWQKEENEQQIKYCDDPSAGLFICSHFTMQNLFGHWQYIRLRIYFDYQYILLWNILYFQSSSACALKHL